MKVSWSEGVGHHQHYHKQERTILSHEWDFVKPQPHSDLNRSNATHNTPKKTSVLNAGLHKWDFELLIPGDLPQTLDSDIGSVSYRLKATIERSTFIQNSVKKKSIRIIRCILPSEFELVQSLEIHNTWAQKMVYDISVPSKLFSFGDTIPISFKILPIASHLRIHAIMASIKEYCTYTANEHTKTDTRIVRLIRLDNPFAEAISTASSPPTWNRVLDLPVPSKSPIIFADADSEMIRIRHRLKFVISLVNADGHISELRCAVQVNIIESFAITEELTALPAYDEMWRSVPYHPQVVETLRTRSSISGVAAGEPVLGTSPPPARELRDSRQPVTISGWSRFLSISSSATPITNGLNEQDGITSSERTVISQPMTIPDSNSSSRHHSRRPSMEDDTGVSTTNSSLSEHPSLWNGIDLLKVPSYRSVSNIDPNMLSASLPPAYDTLINSPRW
ncbi:uncharacterized protein EV154DRAFT_414309 [Mucor mucedo]|uniref:uncharacterized protein n=1 Tax=Mucor mucedo TaxID=29922 RepID=UPI002220AA5E|nr:uncharacterized protein EV154DRAFT_414309 [Mucor mucedo]KAI7894921.1 hypothetical protein EV154DRAFT_414309 [Mucor mucedo]